MSDIEAEQMESSPGDSAGIEYSAGQVAYLHYDLFGWHVGSVLIAAAFIFWGFILSSSNVFLEALVGNLLICSLMSIWRIYAEHYRQIYLFKLHRIRQLEFKLGMWQHRRFVKGPESDEPVYALNGPAGHVLNDLIYAIVSLGGLFLVLVKNTGNLLELRWLYVLLVFFTVLMVVAVIFRVRQVDKTTQNRIRELEN